MLTFPPPLFEVRAPSLAMSVVVQRRLNDVTLPTAATSTEHRRVLGSVLVALWAMCLAFVNVGITAFRQISGVFTTCYRTQVLRVAAQRSFAQVMHLVSLWDWPDKKLIREAVCSYASPVFPGALGQSYCAVAVRVDRSRPMPASRGLVNDDSLHQTLGCRLGSVHNDTVTWRDTVRKWKTQFKHGGALSLTGMDLAVAGQYGRSQWAT